MEQQAPALEPLLRNTVTLELDGLAEEVLERYENSISYFRQWNKSKGIKVDVSGLFGANREVFTTPASGTFYFTVRYKNRSVVFIIEARTLWLTGFVNANGLYEMTRSDQTVHYMEHPRSQWLNFDGNHRSISNSNPGGTLIGMYPMRNAFEVLSMYNGEDPEPARLRSSIGIFVIHICEVKCQAVFDRTCGAFLDPTINRLASEVRAGYGIELFIENWRSLCEEAMEYIHCHFTGLPIPVLNNCGIALIQTVENILSTIRILHRDAFHSGVFKHEPKPVPPQFWEPIDTGEGDATDIPFFNDNNDEDEDSDDGVAKKGKKRWEQKERKRRRPQQQHKFEPRRGGTPGGPPTEVPQGLIDRWSFLQVQVTPSLGSSCVSLRELSLSKCAGVTDTDLSFVVSTLRNLLMLKIARNFNTTDVLLPLDSFYKECSKSLQVLDTSNCHNATYPRVPSVMKAMPNEWELNLSYGCTVTSVGCCFRRVPQLKNLELDGCQFMAYGLKSTGTLSINSSITAISSVAITSLRVEPCGHDTSEGLQRRIGKCCFHLQELNLVEIVDETVSDGMDDKGHGD